MRQSNSTSKIVVGIALAVVFAIGVSVFAIRVKQMQEGQLAQSAGSTATTQDAYQDAAEATAPAQQSTAPIPPDQATSQLTGQPPMQPTAPAADAAVVAPGTNGATDSGTTGKPRLVNRANRPSGGARSAQDRTATRVASVADSGAGSANGSVAQDAAPVGIAGPVGDAAPGGDAATTSTEQADPDSRITAAVKSQIDLAAPDNHVVVTTTNGVVALAGSLPSGDVVQVATQAASRVAGVKYVDSSALEVSNQ